MNKIVSLFLMVFLLIMGSDSADTVIEADVPETEVVTQSYEADLPKTEITTLPPDTTVSFTETPVTEATATVSPVTEISSPETEAPPMDGAVPETESTVPDTTTPETEAPLDFSTIGNYYGIPLPEYDPAVIPYPEIDGSIDPSKPMLALTFDDGPGPHTERLLNILTAHGGKATFFVVGCRIDGNEHLLQKMVSDGHEIGSHSWWHSNMPSLTDRALADEIMMTRERIYIAAGVDTRIVRPPYGAYDGRVMEMGRQFGVAFINWSVDTMDWKTRNPETVHNKIINDAKNGAIILCHDIHRSTVDAMETAIPQLISDGYQLVTVSELMYYSPYITEPGQVYNRQ